MSALASSLDERLDALLASDPAALADPHPLFRELRERAPVLRHGAAVLVSSHSEVKELMRDGVRFSMRAKVAEGTLHAQRRRQLEQRLSEEELHAFDAINNFQGLVMSRNDGAVHRRLRGVAHRAMTPRAVSDSEVVVRRTLDELLASAREHEVCDLRQLAFELPVAVITSMLGVAPDEMALVHGWTKLLNQAQDGGPVADGAATLDRYREYMKELVGRNRRAPDSTPPLASAIFAAHEQELLSLDEMAAMFLNLVFAGHETTSNLIALGMLELLRHPDQWRLLIEAPQLAAGAVDELLRFVTPVQMMIRLALEDVEIGDVPVAAGETLLPVLAAANRDPAVFDQPERLDLMRSDSAGHVAFGFGPHFCLGASLARLEARVTFETLARRYPGIELAADEIVWRGTNIVRTVQSLPVALGTPAAGFA